MTTIMRYSSFCVHTSTYTVHTVQYLHVTCVSMCKSAAPAAGLTFSGVVQHHVLSQLPSVGPPGGDGGVRLPQPVAGQHMLHTLLPEVGRGGDRGILQLWQMAAEMGRNITAEVVLQEVPTLLVGVSCRIVLRPLLRRCPVCFLPHIFHFPGRHSFADGSDVQLRLQQQLGPAPRCTQLSGQADRPLRRGTAQLPITPVGHPRPGYLGAPPGLTRLGGPAAASPAR